VLLAHFVGDASARKAHEFGERVDVRACVRPGGKPVEERWKTYWLSQKIALRGIYLESAPKNADVSACVYGPVLQILQSDLRQGRSLSQISL